MADEIVSETVTEPATKKAAGMGALRERTQRASRQEVVRREPPKPLHPKAAVAAASKAVPATFQSAEQPSSAPDPDKAPPTASVLDEAVFKAAQAEQAAHAEAPTDAETAVVPVPEIPAQAAPASDFAEQPTESDTVTAPAEAAEPTADVQTRPADSTSSSAEPGTGQPAPAAPAAVAEKDADSRGTVLGHVEDRPSEATSVREAGAALEIRAGQIPVKADPATATHWDVRPPQQVSEGYPRAEEVLNQRHITREALNAQIPVELQIPHRIELLRVVSRIRQIPQADFVALAVDWFLRGGSQTPDAMLPPWNHYTGPGEPDEIRRAEAVLEDRFISREPLKAQVPVDLQLGHRIAVYLVMNKLRKTPPADIVAVALDRWLRVMGY
ncbi:hypothetical protein ACFQ0M_47925 [Kitasatospora aburaviensis]|uniref:Uncharacterized protein n=1 Tax=Kitasatospora aburaviensis TaxID=67265 RepID=A0ABW1EYI4_9ACTN